MGLSNKLASTRRAIRRNLGLSLVLTLPLAGATAYLAGKYFIRDAFVGYPIDIDNDGKLEYHVFIETLERWDAYDQPLPSWHWMIEDFTGKKGMKVYADAFLTVGTSGLNFDRHGHFQQSNVFPISILERSVRYILNEDGNRCKLSLPEAIKFRNLAPRVNGNDLELLFTPTSSRPDFEGLAAYYIDNYKLSNN